MLCGIHTALEKTMSHATPVIKRAAMEPTQFTFIVNVSELSRVPDSIDCCLGASDGLIQSV
jgi:hypothetical protein